MKGHLQMLEPQLYPEFSGILLPKPTFRLLIHYVPKIFINENTYLLVFATLSAIN